MKEEIEENYKLIDSYKDIEGNLEFYKSPFIFLRNFSNIKSWKEALRNGREKLVSYNNKFSGNECDLNHYFNIIKEELRENRRIRSKFGEIKDNLKFYKSPVIVTRNLPRIKTWKNALNLGEEKLEKVYNCLREEYKKRFDHLGIEELIREYEKKLPRHADLESRKEYLKDKKTRIGIFEFGKKKKVRALFEDEEFGRRERDLEEITAKIEERGISLEAFYTNKINSFEYSKN